MASSAKTLVVYELCQIDDNNIGLNGNHFFAQTRWNNLTLLHLGIHIEMQDKITYKMRDVNISAKPDG